jgi:hypothetical protein
MVEFACTCGSVLGPSAIVAESADAESSKHRNHQVLWIAPVRRDGFHVLSLVLRANAPGLQET